jgi:hypothetical protein
VIVGVNWRLAAQWSAGDLAATVGNHLVHVHVELRATARHPDVQREHVMVLAGEDLVTDWNDQFIAPIVEPLAGVVCIGGGSLHDGIGGDHLTGNQILADAEVFKRALSLRPPEFIGGNIHFAEAVGFLANVRHFVSP